MVRTEVGDGRVVLAGSQKDFFGHMDSLVYVVGALFKSHAHIEEAVMPSGDVTSWATSGAADESGAQRMPSATRKPLFMASGRRSEIPGRAGAEALRAHRRRSAIGLPVESVRSNASGSPIRWENWRKYC